MAQFNANTTTAEYGNQNKAVADLQASLNAKGANLKVDSKYGPLTQAAVAKYGSTTPPSDTITSGKLKDVTPIPLPDQKPQSYGGLQGAMEGVVQQNQKQSETPQQDAYLQALKESGYISSTIDRTEQDKAKKQSDLYTSQIEQEQLANRRQIENLQKNMQGALASGISIEADRLTRQSLSKQADLAILQTAANRNYDTAASIADRQLEMKLEQSRANLEALKMLDQREYGEITAKKEREYKKQEEVEQQIKQLKLNVAQYGGGVGLLNQLSAIDTTKPGAFDQAIKIAGKYASDPLDRALKQATLSEKYASIAKTKADTEASKLPGAGKPPTPQQIENAGYAKRFEQANKLIDTNAETFKSLNYAKFKLLESNSQLANAVLTPEERQVGLAMRSFITAKLRKESGASISPSEFADARAQYFPSLNDDEATLQQKKELRDGVLQNSILGSGSAYNTDPLDNYIDNVALPTVTGSTVSVKSYLDTLMGK